MPEFILTTKLNFKILGNLPNTEGIENVKFDRLISGNLGYFNSVTNDHTTYNTPPKHPISNLKVQSRFLPSTYKLMADE